MGFVLLFTGSENFDQLIRTHELVLSSENI